MTDGPILSLQGVSRSFGALVAIDNLSLNIAPGEIVGLIGPNGSGKTTLINLLTGVCPPTRGRIRFEDRDITGRSVAAIAARGLTRTFQSPRVYDTLSPLAACAVADGGLRDVRSPMAWVQPWRPLAREAVDALAHVHMPQGPVAASSLSYGKRRLVEIARCLSSRPRMILLDEPTSGLNADEFISLAQQLLETAKDRGLTMIVVDHKIEFLRALCSRLICLVSGKLIADGPLEVIEGDPRVREAYFGVAG